MQKPSFRILLGIVIPGLISAGFPCSVRGQEKTDYFQLAIMADLEMKVEKVEMSINTLTEFNYHFNRKPGNVEVQLDKMRVRVEQNKKKLMEIIMSKAGFESNGKKIPFDEAPEPLKKSLSAGFGKTLCKITVDQDGKELSRKVVAGKDAKVLITNGVIENTRLFHVRFPEQQKWQAERELSMGDGNFARGKLNYEKTTTKGDLVEVKVSGTLRNKSFQKPGTDLIGSASYTVNGTQTYNTKRREWVAGNLKIDLTMVLKKRSVAGKNEKEVGTGNGKMKVILKAK